MKIFTLINTVLIDFVQLDYLSAVVASRIEMRRPESRLRSVLMLCTGILPRAASKGLTTPKAIINYNIRQFSISLKYCMIAFSLTHLTVAI